MSEYGLLLRFVLWVSGLSVAALWAYGSALIVLIGVVIETIADLTEWIKPDRLKKRFEKIGALVLIIGLTGDLISVGKAQIEAGQLNQEAADAKQIAAGAQERASKLEKETAQLRKDAEDERLARVKIEAAVAWRSLNNKQQRDIGKALASFKFKAGASIWYDASSTEAQLFADDIAEALRSGGITTTNVGGMIGAAEGGKWNGPIAKGQTGVILQSTNVPAAIEFASAVLRELSNRGFDITRTKDPPFEKGSSPVIWITVEARPRGPQGKYKLQAEREAKAKKQQMQNNQASH